MKTASIQALADEYNLNYCLIRSITLGLNPVDKSGNRRYYNHAAACKLIDAYLASMQEPDTGVFVYQKIMNTRFKAANETVSQWIKHPQFPKPAGQFIGNNHKIASYWRIDDVQVFLDDFRMKPGHKVKALKPTDKLPKDLIDTKAANDFLKLPSHYLIKAWKQIPDLPQPVLVKRNFYWSKAALKNWLSTLGDNTAHDVFLDYYRRERNFQDSNPFDEAARKFLTGHYATPEQKQAMKRRWEHARRTQPKTHTIQVASQW
jgi:hypothetical protein